MMNYSYTQISQYLTCPRRYRHRYLDGWQEKDVRAAMLFGRCFEQAVAALSVTKIQRPSCSSSGRRARTWNWLTPEVTPGTTCSDKAFSCSSASPRTGACRFTSRRAINRSDSHAR